MKKYAKILVVALLLLTVFVFAVACKDGKSAYDIAVENGFNGSYEEWLDSLKGEQGNSGVPGDKGEQGEQGDKGDAGNDGIDGNDGTDGLSAYEIYCKYHKQYKGSEEEWINAMCDGTLQKSYDTSYNMIFTKATIPPVLSALYSIGNGDNTYALIERGKTYSGIAELGASFSNVGFDESQSKLNFTDEDYDNMLNKIKELNVFGNEKFKIYVRDADLFYGYLFARDAGLNSNQYEIIICEDGYALYNGFQTAMLKGKTVNAEKDEPYDAFVEKVNWVKEYRDRILNSNDININNVTTDWDYILPATVLDNVTLCMQDEDKLISLTEATNNGEYKTKLLKLFNEGSDSNYSVSIQNASISQLVSDLNQTQRDNYIKLMFGSYYQDTYETLTRTTLADNATQVPAKKLVFIGTRLKSYPAYASNAVYGIGGVSTVDEVPNSYAQLDSKYKIDFLFGSEADYNLFISLLSNDDSYATAPTQAQKDAVRVAMFNYYINYIFTLKYTYATYGSEYDIIIKGHPSETIDGYVGWGNNYIADSYNYNKLVNDLMIAFHSQDSMGKYITMIPYGTAAENLAYLGLGDNLAIGGLNSSTYTGYEQSVDVVFVLQNVNTAIDKNTNLLGRYNDGSLVYHENGQEKVTKFINNGNLYKSMYEYFSSHSQTAYANQYKTLYENWLRSQCQLEEGDSLEGYGVDEQGFIIKPQNA